jgi:hypothetical protein
MLTWWLSGAVAAIGIAFVAAVIHSAVQAPVGSVSVGVGITLGLVLGALAAWLRVVGGRHLLIGTLMLALLTAAAQHAWLYARFRQQWHAARTSSPEVAMFRPEAPWSPREYFARELTPRATALWVIDAAILIAAAVVTVRVLSHDDKVPRVASDAAETAHPDT